MEKLTQIFKVIKYQKKDLILFVYQWFRLLLFLEQVKIIFLKCF